MTKTLGIRLDIDEYERLEKLAKASGKNLSQLARELLQTALKQELRDTNLLSRLIQKIESLSEPQPQTSQSQQLQSEVDFEKFKQLFLLLVSLIREHGRLVFVLPEKAQKFSQIADEIEKKISEF